MKTHSIKQNGETDNILLVDSTDKVQLNQIFTTQLQELARHFSAIENHYIRQYAINLIKELAKCETQEKAQSYIEAIVESLEL